MRFLTDEGCTPNEKGQQISNIPSYQQARSEFAPDGLRPLKTAARHEPFSAGGVRKHFLRQIRHLVYEVSRGIGGVCDLIDGAA